VTIPFTDEAAEEFYQALQYYEEQSSGLGAELLADVERLSGLLVANPEMGSAGKSGTRRVLLSRFPFVVVYMLREGRPLIVAFAHQKREPGYWSDRT
jgi:plasmid stabilization system protein ParE